MRCTVCVLALSLLFVGPDALTRNGPATATGAITVSCDPEVRRCD